MHTKKRPTSNLHKQWEVHKTINPQQQNHRCRMDCKFRKFSEGFVFAKLRCVVGAKKNRLTGAQKNRLNETVLLNTHYICFAGKGKNLSRTFI